MGHNNIMIQFSMRFLIGGPWTIRHIIIIVQFVLILRNTILLKLPV